MNQKIGLFFAFVLSFFLALYVVFDAKDVLSNSSSLSELLQLILDVPQKYFLNYSLMHLPILYFLKQPYLTPTHQTRLQPRLFEYVMKRTMKLSLFIAACTWISYFVSAIISGISVKFTILLINFLVRLILFSVLNQLVMHVLYCLLKKETLALLGMFLYNFLVLLLFRDLFFQASALFLFLYISLGMISFALVFLYLVQRKEYIS